jgi:hypothetical protein
MESAICDWLRTSRIDLHIGADGGVIEETAILRFLRPAGPHILRRAFAAVILHMLAGDGVMNAVRIFPQQGRWGTWVSTILSEVVMRLQEFITR